MESIGLSHEYSTVPFWVWNDWMTPLQLEQTLDTLAAQHIRQVIVHPRPGLMTPYLSDEWFKLWEASLALARMRGMALWIYDENSYPSGFAGGHVAEAMPDSRALGLKLVSMTSVEMGHPDYLAVYRTTPGGYMRVMATAGQHRRLPDGDYRIAVLERAGTSAWYGGRFHTDLLRPGVTAKFLEVTLEPYRRRFGHEFGKTILGVFTDEPHLKPCGDIHWTPDLPEQFRRRWGSDFFEGLPHLKDATAEGRCFRHHYFQLINELFVDRWAKPYYAYCAEAGLELTGHYWEHGWPSCATVPDNMAMAAWQQRPGIDILFNEYDEGPQAQFGNVRSVLELASVANQTGRTRTLCETYGGSGAEMTFEDYKRIGDWVTVLGVNTINEHLSSVSLRGARKRDYPPTFSYHSPWMTNYNALVDYFTRVCTALTRGKQVNPILVLEPTSSAWMHHFEESSRLQEIGNQFQAWIVQLAQAQVEFDLGSEHIIQERGSVAGSGAQARFRVGERAYELVVIPAEMESLNRATADLLARYVELGGRVIVLGAPDRSLDVDGAPSPVFNALRRRPELLSLKPGEAVTELVRSITAPTRVVLAPGNRGVVYHHRRQLDTGDIVFITNTSKGVSAVGQVEAWASGIRVVDLDTGMVQAAPFSRRADGEVVLPFTLPPCGSLLIYCDARDVPGCPVATTLAGGEVVALSPMVIRRLEDNNLILDYVDVEAGGETRMSLYWRKAAEFIFQKNGLAGNPWDHAVQFRDELLKTAFPRGSGFTATYRFTLEGGVPPRLRAAIERADLYQIECNGVALQPSPGDWWLDRSMGVVDLVGAARVGENTLKVKAAPMTVFHEFEAAHVLGDFSVKAVAKGFVVTPALPLAFGDWSAQGLPLYGHRVAYSAAVTLSPQKGRRFHVSLPSWKGVVAEVRINGHTAGLIYRHPMQCEITAAVQAGENVIEVVVSGSLRNPLGPHLGVKQLAITDPWSWGRGPQEAQPSGREYYAVPYGLDRPFEVRVS